MASPIPVRNVYYLLIYAWNQLAQGELTDVSVDDSSELVDLLASVLISGANHLLRRGLDQSYLTHEEEISGVRGRINIGVTARRMLTSHGRAYCEFDELSVDTLPNQILRATVDRLLKVRDLDFELRNKLRGLNRELAGIRSVRLTRAAFRSVQLHSNNSYYRFLLNVCELVWEMGMVDETAGSYKFRDFIRDERRMARLFESFVLNFLRAERPELDVRSEMIQWVASSSSDPQFKYLPSMRTDISVRDDSRTLIIDAKFYKETFQSYFERQTIHSSNLYQIYSYLKNLEIRGGNDASASGMLLYPAVNEKVRLTYNFPGHRIHICTVDLAREWRDIREELLELVAA